MENNKISQKEIDALIESVEKMNVNKLTKKEVIDLIEKAKKQSLKKELLIIKNTNDKEMEGFLKKVEKAGYKKTIFENEEFLMNDLLNKKFNEKEIIVWNLSEKNESVISNFCYNNEIQILGKKLQYNNYKWTTIAAIPTYSKADLLFPFEANDTTKRKYVFKSMLSGVENEIFSLTLLEAIEILNQKMKN